MPAPLHIDIAEPCHENWQQMTPNEQGRHCGACQKTVVDFTRMSDQEVLDYISRASSSVCGRFYNHQLDKTYAEQKIKPAFTFRYAWNLITAAFLLTGSAASAQVKKKAKKKAAAPKEWEYKYTLEHLKPNPRDFRINIDLEPVRTYVTLGLVASTDYVEQQRSRLVDPPLKMFGFIRDNITGKPINAATVQLKGVKAGVEAADDGRFEFPIVAISGKVTLEVTAKGYVTKEYEVDVNSFRSMDFSLESDGSIVYDDVHDLGTTMGDVAVIRPTAMGKVAVKDTTLVEVKIEETVCGGVTMGAPVVRIPDEDDVEKPVRHIKDGVIISDKPVFDSLEPVEVVAYPTTYCKRISPPSIPQKVKLPISLDSITIVPRESTVTPATAATKQVKWEEKELLPAKSDVRIYPNPVMPGNLVNISLSLNKTGDYKLELMDASGRVVHVQALQIVQQKQVVNISTQSTWSRGAYWVRISGATDKKAYHAKLLLQ